MNNRLSLKAIKDFLSPMTVTGVGEVHVGSCYDREYMSDYGKTFPAIWIAGQELTPLDKGQGFSGNFTQKIAVTVPFRIVVGRYAEGETDPEAQISLIHGFLSDKIKDWTPPGAEKPFTWRNGKDGPANESLLVADLYFSTQVRYQRTVT